MTLSYSVIIPTLNEEHYLERCLSFLSNYDVEKIVVDGGSSDGTLDIAGRFKAQVINSKKGRGIQQNEGAKAASGDILCFLHADTLPPKNFLESLISHFELKKNKIARFKLGFDIKSKLFKLYSYFTKYESYFTSFGDMLICVRKDYFLSIGGFPNWNFMEDVEFFRKARKSESIKILDYHVISSARNFIQYGIVKQQIHSTYFLLKYFLGFRKFIESNNYNLRKSEKKIESTITFAKYPEEGKVKTRLASTIGNNKALDIYRVIAQNVFIEINKLRGINNYIFYSGDEDAIIDWIGGTSFFTEQEGDDLGTKMLNAFEMVFNHGSTKAVIVGTDIPNLSTFVIENAFDILNDSDIVIGPSPDGGYYLLGMKKRNRFLFENIEFSTDNVLSETIARISKNELTYKLLPELGDIDTEQDLTNWLSKNEESKLYAKINSIYN